MRFEIKAGQTGKLLSTLALTAVGVVSILGLTTSHHEILDMLKWSGRLAVVAVLEALLELIAVLLRKIVFLVSNQSSRH